MIAKVLALLGMVCAAISAQAQDLSSEELARRAIERRAVEAVIWGMPAVNAELMFQAMRDAKADFNQVVYWSRPVNFWQPSGGRTFQDFSLSGFRPGP